MPEVLQTASTAVLASSLIFFISGLLYVFLSFFIINPLLKNSLSGVVKYYLNLGHIYLTEACAA